MRLGHADRRRGEEGLMQVCAVGLEPGPWGGLSLSDGSRVFGKRLVTWLEFFFYFFSIGGF